VTTTAPDAGTRWADSGAERDRRGLKHRGEGEIGTVPIPPPQVRLFRAHLDQYGTSTDAHVFRGVKGGMLATITYRRVWDRARQAAFDAGEYMSPLARRRYDLRHACLSTWLNGGVAPAQVAEWAGHSVEVLLRTYVRCLDGQHDIAKRRIMEALDDPAQDDSQSCVAQPDSDKQHE
jgi:integrase